MPGITPPPGGGGGGGASSAADVTFDDSGLVVITGVSDVQAALALVDAQLDALSGASVPALLVAIPVNHDPVSNVNWSTRAFAAGYAGGGYLASSGAQNAEVVFSAYIPAGSYDINLIGSTGTDFGIATVAIDGTDVGTADFYSGGSVSVVRKTIASVTVAASGLKQVRFKMATKNASSTNYFCYLQDSIRFRPLA
jgi:hypothetical protein